MFECLLTLPPSFFVIQVVHSVPAQLTLSGAWAYFQQTSSGTPLQWAILNADLGVFRSLVAAGANLEARRNHLGPTALQSAVQLLNVEMTKILVDAGADVNARVLGEHVGLLVDSRYWPGYLSTLHLVRNPE